MANQKKIGCKIYFILPVPGAIQLINVIILLLCFNLFKESKDCVNISSDGSDVVPLIKGKRRKRRRPKKEAVKVRKNL